MSIYLLPHRSDKYWTALRMSHFSMVDKGIPKMNGTSTDGIIMVPTQDLRELYEKLKVEFEPCEIPL